jgi:hypothetical protein
VGIVSPFCEHQTARVSARRRMDFYTFQVLFYVVVFIIEVYKFFSTRHQNKKLAQTIDQLGKFIDKNNQLDK